MKKLVLGVVITFLLVLSACSLNQYLPADNQTSVIVLNDTFSFANETTDVDNTTMTPNKNGTSENLSQENEDNFSDEDTNLDQEDENEDTSMVLTTVTVTEGEIASLDFLEAQDPDGDVIDFTYSTPFNNQGLWQTNDGDEGKYLVTVTASDGLLSTTETIQVVVLPSNKGPVVDCPSTFTVKENEFIDIPCTIYDREGDEVTFEVSGFMDSLTYQTDYNDQGSYNVLVTASDGIKTTVHEIELVIEDVNRLPVVEPVEKIELEEGDMVTIDIVATDADDDELTITYPFFFEDDGTWQTEKGDASNYDLEVIVSDGKDDVVVPVELVLKKINTPPTLEPIDPITVNEGDIITIDVVAEDEDGDELDISFSGFMEENTYTTTYDDAGEYTVTVTVSDGKTDVSTDVAITVVNVNRPPVFVVK